MLFRTLLSPSARFRPVAPSVLALAVWLATASSGCRSVRQDWDVPTGPAFAPKNFTSIGEIPAHVRRVAVLPLYCDSWPAADVVQVETAFAGELVKTARFETAAVTREQMRDQFGTETVMSSSALPADMLERLRASHGADAVLFQELTHYSPYQPIAIGVRSKLVSVVDGRVLWSFDDLFDAAQPSVAVAVREYYLEEGRRPRPLDSSSSMTQSPSRFAKYVAHAVFGTLPSRGTR